MVLQTMLPLVVLLPLVLLLGAMGRQSVLYCFEALLLSLGFFYYGAQFVLRRSSSAARRLLLASIIYLPSLFALMMLPIG